MSEVQAVKSLDTVKLISHLLERTYSKQMSDVWNIGLKPGIANIRFTLH